MRDSLDDLELDLGRLPDIRNAESQSPSPAQQIRRALRGKHVCPFCGTQRETDLGACLHCSLEDTPTTRSATRSKLGPWYVLQSRNPSAPGMNFVTLMVLVQKGRVTARSVLRGPTTGQFWRHAAKVKGISREFGLCWNCGGDVAKTARACPACKRLQEPPLNPDVLLENGEFSGEELAEAMWSDQVPNSSQMSASSQVHPRTPPQPSPVDRLVSRGGVRRELPPHAQETGVGGLPPAPRPQRGGLTEGVEELPPSALEMAVFQMPPRHAEVGTAPMVRRASRKVLKSLGVAVLLLAAGLVAMCTFDESFRKRVVQYGQKGWAWVQRSVGAQPPPGFQVDPSGDDAAAPTNGPSRPPGADGSNADPSASTKDRGGAPLVASEWTKRKINELWKAGNEADRRGDFVGAVRSWEAMKALPAAEDDLPIGVDARIAAAKKRIK